MPWFFMHRTAGGLADGQRLILKLANSVKPLRMSQPEFFGSFRGWCAADAFGSVSR